MYVREYDAGCHTLLHSIPYNQMRHNSFWIHLRFIALVRIECSIDAEWQSGIE